MRFGVAGWTYADWKDVVYPRNCKDTLRAVAQRVDLIEINNTFYRPPSAKNCKSWVERTADLGTLFTAKLPHEFTHERRFDAALRPHGLTNGQFSLLMALNRPEGPRIGDLVPLLGMDRTTLTAALKPLERRGLVTSHADEADRRARLLVLTEAGRATLADAMPAWRRAQAETAKLIGRSDPDDFCADLKALS